MYTLNDLSTEELEYLHSKWTSEITELSDKKNKRETSLNRRLNSQEEDAIELQDIEAERAHAQAMYDTAVAASAPQSQLDRQLVLIDELQQSIDGYSASSAYVSKTGSLLIQLELAVIEQEINLRQASIAAIDALT